MTVEQLIGDLLLQHNCVVVPSFGGFVAQRVSAQFDKVKGVMTPPRKAVLFNRQLINNDGLLIASLAHHNKVSFDDAYRSVSESISQWENNLANGERIAIDRVGYLFLDAERNLCFEQDKFYNLLLESYGLGKIHFVSASDAEAKTTHDAVQELIKETLEAPVVEFDSKQPVILTVVEPDKQQAKGAVIDIRTKKNNTWKYIAAAVILPIGFYSFWIPMKTDVLQSGILSLSDFNPFHKTEQGTYSPKKGVYALPEKHQPANEIPENAESYSYQLDEETYIPVKGKAGSGNETSATVISPKSAPVKTVPKQSVNVSGSLIIVGCFSNADNAEKMAAELRSKGYNAQTVPSNGMTRVSAGNGAEFSALQSKLTADGYKPWLLK